MLALLMSACTTREIIETNPCAGFELFRPSRMDTEGSKRQALVHNTIYRAKCVKDKNERNNN